MNNFSPKFDIKCSQAKDGWKTSLISEKCKVLNPILGKTHQ